MDKKISLKDIVSKRQIWAPNVWDCITTKIVERSGFEAVVLSTAALAYSMGVPDIGLLTLDEVVFATRHICASTSMAVIVDAEGGYGDTPLHAYQSVKRFAEAGASAVLLDDFISERGFERAMYANDVPSFFTSHETLPEDIWLAKIKAAAKAVEGTGCLVVARSEDRFLHSMDDSINRCKHAQDVGADMSLIYGTRNYDDCKEIGEKLPGIKIYPDISSQNGVSNVNVDEIDEFGFKIITCHFLEKAAMRGMLDFSKHVYEEKTTVYADLDDMGCGCYTWDQQIEYMCPQYHSLLEMEKEFKKI